MNKLISLNGEFKKRPSKGGGGGAKLNSSINAAMVENIIKQLKSVQKYWEHEKHIDGVLLSVHYVSLIPKSRKIKQLFTQGKMKPDHSVVGAKYIDNKHVITHFITDEILEQTILEIEVVLEILNELFAGSISKEESTRKTFFDIVNLNENRLSMKKSQFKSVLADITNVKMINVEHASEITGEAKIVTFYNVEQDLLDFFQRIGLHQIQRNRIIGNETALLYEAEYSLLLNKAPYLISMALVDYSELCLDDFETEEHVILDNQLIPSPKNEPTIGVIDTLFDESVYFSEWVETHNFIDSNIEVEKRDYYHGTSVCSIIVDGPRLNEWLDDNCGYFKVRHFGVAAQKGFSSFYIIRQIETIVKSNRDINVWNLSLGSKEEINDNFISIEAAELDRIQYENDVIFVVAGTNNANPSVSCKIGAPADSINSLVVNSVSQLNYPANYSRKGLVLKFFNKPDVAYYGGCQIQYMNVIQDSLGQVERAGTSYAAPWIARKLSFLIDKLSIPREVAKAMIVDSAIGWQVNNELDYVEKIGFGIVPKDINEIIKTDESQIKFYVTGKSSQDETYSFDFPVPINEKNRFPYKAKATMSYFTNCTRSQGVDYTNTELSFKFGPVKSEVVKAINGDSQRMPECLVTEETAKNMYKKWDNIKFVTSESGRKTRGKEANTPNATWGMQINSLARFDDAERNIKFGIIVTLEAVDGVNRIDEFKNKCRLKGWIANEIEIEKQIELNEIIEEDLIFD